MIVPRPRNWLIVLVLLDLPVIVVALTAGWAYGFVHTYEAVSAWRLAHPWSFLPSVALVVAVVWRWRTRA